MGIYIRGMEMPKNCIHCCAFNDETKFCRVLVKYIPMSGILDYRYLDCPLVEVKKPHGDLIDREVIKQDLSDFYSGIVTARRLIDAQDVVIEGEGVES